MCEVMCARECAVCLLCVCVLSRTTRCENVHNDSPHIVVPPPPPLEESVDCVVLKKAKEHAEKNQIMFRTTHAPMFACTSMTEWLVQQAVSAANVNTINLLWIVCIGCFLVDMSQCSCRLRCEVRRLESFAA